MENKLTAEEAIESLKYLSKHSIGYDDAITMAIEALRYKTLTDEDLHDGRFALDLSEFKDEVMLNKPQPPTVKAEEFYDKWKPNGFYNHNPIEFMTDLFSVIEQSQPPTVTDEEIEEMALDHYPNEKDWQKHTPFMYGCKAMRNKLTPNK